MNFLAHLFLSGSDPKIKVGNFIGDFVKGKNVRERYEAAIAKGIELHRGIDYFTDLHPIVRQSKNRLRPKYNHFSGIIVDMFYDHFLANNWHKYSMVPLAHYAAEAYDLINQHWAVLPNEAQQLFPYMQKGNWLVGYAKVDGIERALEGMTRRTSYDSKMNESIADLNAFYRDFQSEFEAFFPEAQQWASQWILTYQNP